MTAFILRDVEAADSLALARLDDDGAPAAVTSTVPHGSTKTAGKPSGAGGGAPPAIPAGPPSARVSFDPALSRRGAVDGGWWPRSRNAHAELPGLIAALDARPGVRVQRLAVHRDEWDDIPHRLTADNGHFARVDWFTTIPRHTVSVTTAGGREPIALLVVPPQYPCRSRPDRHEHSSHQPRHRRSRDRTSLRLLGSRAASELERPLGGSCRCANPLEDYRQRSPGPE